MFLGRVPGCRVFSVADNWVICNSICLIDIACHFVQHILNSRHNISTIRRSDIRILRRDIGPILIIFVTIVTPVEVVVAVVVSMSDIMTLTVVVTIVPTLVPLTLTPIILI